MQGDNRTFQANKVENIVRDMLDSRLQNVEYDVDLCSSVAKQLCCGIRERTKQFNYEGCRLVTQVLIGQDSQQNIHLASRCLWNTAMDNFAAVTFRNASLYAVVVVYGVHIDS